MKRRLLDLIFPLKCPFCRRVVERGCPCALCRLPQTAPALREGGGLGRCASPLYYEGLVRESLLRYKFYGQSASAVAYGELLAACVAEEFSGEFDCVTWVPLSKKRRRTRGYDQTELLARATAKNWETKPLRLLEKIVDTPAQSTLRDASARRANVLGVYEARSRAQIAGRRILLIDDILTSGSTLSECRRVLLEAGAAEVLCTTLAVVRPLAPKARGSARG